MYLERKIIEDCRILDIPMFWIQTDLKKDAAIPCCVINYLNDEQDLFLDRTLGNFSGRLTFTIYSKDEVELMNIKTKLRKHLLKLEEWSFSENLGLTNYDDQNKLYIYQMDMYYYLDTTPEVELD